MRRAFVGFSSPIGYSYEISAPRTRNDTQSSPNPVLFGSMGLLLLYDEIWFACESLCPEAMRQLPYVKFLDVHEPEQDLRRLRFDEVINRFDEVAFPENSKLDEMFIDGFGKGMTEYLGGEFATDNHTHGLQFMGTNFNGNPGSRQLAADIWLVERSRDLKLELVLNPLTTRMGLGDGVSSGLAKADQLGLADRIFTFGSLYDITGPFGPYHPAIEEVRGDQLLVDFRSWMNNQRNRLDNQEMATIEADVNARVRELQQKSLRDAVRRENPTDIIVKVGKDAVIGAVPGANIFKAIADVAAQNQRADTEGWKAFIALGRLTLEDIRRRE